MNGRQWVQTLSELGTSVWETANLPEGYWNKDNGFQESKIHMPPVFAGVSDGVVEELTGYPQLIKLGYDVATKAEVRNGLWESVKNISVESIKTASIEFYEKKKDNYTSDKPYIVQHTVSKDAVQLASAIVGVGGIKGVVSNVDEGVEQVGKTFAKKVFKNAKELVDDIVAKRGIIRNNIIDLAESRNYAKLYANKIGVKDADFEKWFDTNFKKYEGGTLNFEAHHVIPVDVLKTNPDLKELLFNLQKKDPNFKFDFNKIENGMMVQKKSLKLDINGHTVHNDYNREISRKVSEIIKDAGGDNQIALKNIERLIKTTKEKLKIEVLLGDKNVNDIINF